MRALGLLLIPFGCGRLEFAECDRCTSPGERRCVEGVVQTCVDEGGGCVGWGLDQPCAAGTCADDVVNLCGILSCPSAPVSVQPMFLPTGGNACTADPVDGFADYQLAESSEGGAIEIDGELVSGCWVADFGAACTPYLMGLNAAITNSPVCGDDCGGVCQQCAATSDSEVLLFYGAALDRLQLRTRMPLSVGTTAGAGFTGTPRPDVRYLVACRPACGPAGYNVAVGPFTLGN